MRALARLADELDAEIGDGADLAGALGLEPAELAPRLDEDRYRLREALEMLDATGGSGGVGIFQAHWSDFAHPLAARVAARLAAGAAAVVLGDPRLPRAAEALARALERVDLPVGLVALLHDDGGETLARAFESSGLAWARLKALDEELERAAGARGARPIPVAAWPVRNASMSVARDADPAASAALAVERAIGRSATLSGQLPGQVARLFVHPRLFSRFSEELLARLAAAPDAARPVPPLDSDLGDHVRAAALLGIDEGATLLVEDRGGGARRGGHAAARAIGPHVFTNVDAAGRLVRLRRPAPVLALIRATADEAEAWLRIEREPLP